ncbi:MAG: hypothetical protein K6G88_06065 [Lachnospiraceae bacterium]|nr:hypothetical protein [Lachnospiraceae bacterium]
MKEYGKWAKQIIDLQDDEGKWGIFHSMSQPTSSKQYTTEQALRRLEYLGLTEDDECIQNALDYMSECIKGIKKIPDYEEKKHDWDNFTKMMLATWIRRFTSNNDAATEVANKWAKVITGAFKSGKYSNADYEKTYDEVFGIFSGKCVIGMEIFYPVSLVQGCLDENTEKLFVYHLLNESNGIYYIYDKDLSQVPANFESKEASRYLAAIEMLAKFKSARSQLDFVVDWLNENKNENGKWDMGKNVSDKLYFPIADSWRSVEARENDCTQRITRLMNELLDK